MPHYQVWRVWIVSCSLFKHLNEDLTRHNNVRVTTKGVWMHSRIFKGALYHINLTKLVTIWKEALYHINLTKLVAKWTEALNHINLTKSVTICKGALYHINLTLVTICKWVLYHINLTSNEQRNIVQLCTIFLKTFYLNIHEQCNYSNHQSSSCRTMLSP